MFLVFPLLTFAAIWGILSMVHCTGALHNGRRLSIGEPNPVSPSAGLLTAFGLVLLALRQQGCVVRTQNRPKFLVEGCYAVFPERQGAKTRKTPQGISADIFKEFSAVLVPCRPGKPGWVRFPYAYPHHPKGGDGHANYIDLSHSSMDCDDQGKTQKPPPWPVTVSI